ncbi:hypothetical protein V6N12_051201 [Hibiscus sabdariffa]|uniref:RNase H type-1 domain-containing protein n=1 Tax=Hibiscus sabdariffa TaxID=183260 RepID=A0ABR2GEM2_9ROSI
MGRNKRLRDDTCQALTLVTAPPSVLGGARPLEAVYEDLKCAMDLNVQKVIVESDSPHLYLNRFVLWLQGTAKLCFNMYFRKEIGLRMQ